MLGIIQIWLLNWSLNLYFHLCPSLPVYLPLCCPPWCPILRSFLPFPLRGRLPWRRPRWPLLDPGTELSDPLSEWRENGALLQEGLCGRPPSRYRWRWTPLHWCWCTHYGALVTGCLPGRFVFGCLPLAATWEIFSTLLWGHLDVNSSRQSIWQGSPGTARVLFSKI